jgi:hypothetical protein
MERRVHLRDRRVYLEECRVYLQEHRRREDLESLVSLHPQILQILVEIVELSVTEILHIV